MKVCPSCQATYTEDMRVCGACGANLVLQPATMPEDPQQKLVGRVIGHNYRIEELLGKGGMGAVYRARQLSLERDVAIKVLLGAMALEPELLERFQREARAASNIGHPSIIQVIDLGYLDEGPPFIAMEYLQGEDLRAKLSREGALSAAEAIPLMLQICEGLGAAHEKTIVHRDLKPENIFLVYRQGKIPMVKLLDFGLSKIKSSDDKLTNTGALLGTPHYMSPEQVRGGEFTDYRTDIYAAGVILYEMLTGRCAYQGPSVQSILVSIATEDPPRPRTLRPDIPQPVENVILRAIARDPNQRYQSLGEMAHELGQASYALGYQSTPSIVSGSGPPGTAPSSKPPSGQSQLGSGYRMGPPGTPPPVAVSGIDSTATPPKKSSARGILIALVLLGTIAIGAALMVVIVALGIFFLAPRSADEISITTPDEEVNISFAHDDHEGIDKIANLDPDDPSPIPKPSQSSVHIGTGGQPHLCCGTKSCALVYISEEGSHMRIRLRPLGSDLYPTSEPIDVSPTGQSGRWPACFARDDGGTLVFWQQAMSPFSGDPGAKLHRVVVDADGKVGKVRSSFIHNVGLVDDFEPSYTTAVTGDRVLVLWNHWKGVNTSMKLSIFDLDGGQFKSDIVVSSSTHVHQPSLACSDTRCVISWQKPALPMNHVQKLSVIDTGGKVIEKDITVFDRGVLISKRTLVPSTDDVAFAWVEQDDSGNSWQMLARYDFSGKETLKPTKLEQFGNAFDAGDTLTYLSGIPTSDKVAIVRVRPDEKTEEQEAVCLLLDTKAEVSSVDIVSFGDEGIEDTAVFHDASGKALIVFVVGDFMQDQKIYVTRFDGN